MLSPFPLTLLLCLLLISGAFSCDASAGDKPNVPICNPSRASFATGIYPHTPQQFGFENWDDNEVLKNSRTMMAHFSANGYHSMGTGKVMHNRDKNEWDEYGHTSDYGPFAYDGGKVEPHLDQPVKIVARIKAAKTGRTELMVHIVSIKPPK